MPETDTLTTAKPPFDVDKIRKDFPILARQSIILICLGRESF